MSDVSDDQSFSDDQSLEDQTEDLNKNEDMVMFDIKHFQGVIEILKQKSLTDEIFEKAREILISIGIKNVKGARKLRLAFYCIYQALLSKGQIVFPEQVMNNYGFTDVKISKSITEFQKETYSYFPPIIEFSPKDLMINFGGYFGFNEEEVDKISKIINDFLQNFDKINKSKIINLPPQKITASFICYFGDLLDKEISNNLFKEYFGIKRESLNNYIRSITSKECKQFIDERCKKYKLI